MLFSICLFFSEKNNWLMFLIACLFFSSSFPEQSFHSLLHLNLVLEGSVNPAIFNWEREWEQIFSKFEASQRRVQRQFSLFFIEIFVIWNFEKKLLFFAMSNKHTSLSWTSRSIPEENNSQLDNWLFFLPRNNMHHRIKNLDVAPFLPFVFLTPHVTPSLSLSLAI